MEAENQAVCEVVSKEFLTRRFSLPVDCHSGFGVNDRLWFPYAHTRRPIPHLAELHALKDLLQETLCNYRYIFEPQSRHYLAHGDLWDHLYLRSQQTPGRVFLPMTLEMGFLDLGEEEPPPVLFPARDVQSPDRAPPAARVAAPPAPAGVLRAGGLQTSKMVAIRWGDANSITRGRHGALVPRT